MSGQGCFYLFLTTFNLHLRLQLDRKILTVRFFPNSAVTPRNGLLAGFLWCFIAVFLASYMFNAINLAFSCGLSVLSVLALLRFFRRRLQGFTGDCLGCTQQVCEIAFYLGLAVSL